MGAAAGRRECLSPDWRAEGRCQGAIQKSPGGPGSVGCTGKLTREGHQGVSYSKCRMGLGEQGGVSPGAQLGRQPGALQISWGHCMGLAPRSVVTVKLAVFLSPPATPEKGSGRSQACWVVIPGPRAPLSCLTSRGGGVVRQVSWRKGGLARLPGQELQSLGQSSAR